MEFRQMEFLQKRDGFSRIRPSLRFDLISALALPAQHSQKRVTKSRFHYTGVPSPKAIYQKSVIPIYSETILEKYVSQRHFRVLKIIVIFPENTIFQVSRFWGLGEMGNATGVTWNRELNGLSLNQLERAS